MGCHGRALCAWAWAPLPLGDRRAQGPLLGCFPPLTRAISPQYNPVTSRIPFPDVGCHMENCPKRPEGHKDKTPIRALRSQTCWPEGIWEKLSLKAACMLEGGVLTVFIKHASAHTAPEWSQLLTREQAGVCVVKERPDWSHTT